MKYAGLLTLCLLSFALTVHAQEITLSGILYSKEDGKALPGVNIVVHPSESGKVIIYGTSKPSGEFSIKIAADKTHGAIISFSFIGFETVTQELSGSDQVFKIYMATQPVNIKEVWVKAPKIRAQGDTLVYSVGSYAKEYDRTIGDVLKRMPGIEVKENGQISFNGQPINKFYIEGSDMLEGKYGIATNSISSKDVGSVEVLQNHQPVRALEGLSFSDKAAINLKLKEDAKYRWVGTMQGGVGFTPFLWDVRLTAMRFTKKLQTLNTYKTNNTGVDATREFTSFDLKDISNRSYQLPDYIAINPPPSLGLDRKRELFNHTHQLSINNLTKVGKDFDLKVNASYLDHRETADNSTETLYYQVQGDTTRISEDEASKFYRKNLDVGLVLEANKPRYNLTDKLTGNFSWTDRKVSVIGSYPNSQQARSPRHQVSNDFYLLKRFGEKNFATFTSYTTYQSHPQQLEVSRTSSMQTQDVHQPGFFTNNNGGYGFALGRVMTTFTAGVSVMQKSLDTELKGIESTVDHPTGEMRLGYVRTYLTPELEYQYRILKATLSLPVDYYTYMYKDKLAGQKTTYDILLFSPALTLRMDLTSKLMFSVSTETGKSAINDKLFYPSVILNDYRSLSAGLPEFIHDTRTSISSSLSYKRPLDELFSGLSLTRSWNKTPYTPTQLFVEDYLLYAYSPETNKSRTWFLMGFFNKGIDFLKGYFFLNVSWLRNDASLIRDNASLASTHTDLIVTPKIEMSPIRWFVFNYSFSYSHSGLSLENESGKITNNSFSQTLFARFLPTSKLNITLSGEHYFNELAGTEKKHFLLADAGLSYRLSKRLEVTLDITNILNQKTYSYMSLTDDASSICHRYQIRGRNVLLSMYYVY